MILFMQNSRKCKIVVTTDPWLPRTVYCPCVEGWGIDCKEIGKSFGGC